MCNRCDYDSPDNQIYVDPLTNEYYLDIETKNSRTDCTSFMT